VNQVRPTMPRMRRAPSVRLRGALGCTASSLGQLPGARNQNRSVAFLAPGILDGAKTLKLPPFRN